MLSAGHEELTALERITLLPGASDVGANGAFPASGDAALQQVVQRIDHGFSDHANVGIDAAHLGVFFSSGVQT